MERFEEAKRWFLQAVRDLKASKDSHSMGNFEWSVFQAQQSAEKSLKSLLHAHGRGAWGHSVLELFEALRDIYELEVDYFLPKARELDRHYIPSRYPNVFESGYPGQYYDEETSTRSIQYAEEILNWVKKKLEETGLKL
ncbi:MAG: HEPN domain-containing protein [Nitrososphaerota archaeon]